MGYTDPTCDGFIRECKDKGALWGFYHFARENEPEDEAEYFYSECRGYFNHGIPVLDYETENYDNAQWCERFLNRLHELSGVWAVLYISASRCSQYDGSWVPERCGLWVAGYPWEMKRTFFTFVEVITVKRPNFLLKNSNESYSNSAINNGEAYLTALP